jgi:hypothetical protein
MTSNGRVGRLTALALATGTLVAAGATGAAAATSTAPRTTTTSNQIQALGNGSVVHVRIALPAGAAALPTGNIIDQYISLTDGTVTTINSLGAKSVGTIGKGAVPVLSDLLNGRASSDLAGKHADSVALADTDNAALGLSLRALAAKSNVAKPDVDGVLAHSESTVASLKLNALGLPALSTATQPVIAALTSLVGAPQQSGGGSATTATTAATSTIAGVVKTATDQLDAATQNATTPVSDQVKAAVAQVTTALDTLVATIQGQVGALDANTSLIDLGVMSSQQTISRTGTQVTSDVKNALAGLSLLGGLVSVDALSSEAQASAGGRPGTASVLHTPGVLTVHVADALTLKIGKTIELGGTLGDALPADLKQTVNDTLATVLGMLRDQLGLDFQPGSAVESISADGTKALTTVNAAKLSLNPPALAALLPKGEKLVTVELVGAQAAVGSNVVALRTVVAPEEIKALPRTGADLPLTGAIATGLVGLALVIRRRRQADVAR